jgi:hypothetical protein
MRMNSKLLLSVILAFSSLFCFSQYQPDTYLITAGGNSIPSGNTYLPVCDVENNIVFYANDPTYSGHGLAANSITFELFKNGVKIEGKQFCDLDNLGSSSENPLYKHKVTFSSQNLTAGTYFIGVYVKSHVSFCWESGSGMLGYYETYPFTISCGYEDPSKWTVALANPNAPANCVGNIAMKSDGTGIYYRGSDNKMNSIWYNGGPQWGVLNNNVTNVAGDITLNYSETSLYYRGTDGKLNYFFYNNGQWNWGVLSNSVTNVAGDIVVSHNNNSVYYRGTDGKLNYFFYNNGQWNWGVLSNSVTNVAGDICISTDDKNIFYRGTDNKLYIFYYQSGWKWGVVRNDINNVAGSVKYTYNTNYVNYRGTDNKMYWVKYNGGWQWGVLNNTVADCAGDITLSSNTSYVNYRATDGRIKFLANVNGGWNTNAYISYRYNNIAGSLISNSSGSILVAQGTDNKIYRFVAPNTTAPNRIATNKDNVLDVTSIVNSKIVIYPNPARNIINIQLPAHDGNIKVEAYNIEGKMIYSRALNAWDRNFKSFQIGVNSWTKGTYLIKVSGNKLLHTQKIIVQ